MFLASTFTSATSFTIIPTRFFCLHFSNCNIRLVFPEPNYPEMIVIGTLPCVSIPFILPLPSEYSKMLESEAFLHS